MKLEKTAIYNVIGIVTGREEPGKNTNYDFLTLFHQGCKKRLSAEDYAKKIYILFGLSVAGSLVQEINFGLLS